MRNTKIYILLLAMICAVPNLFAADTAQQIIARCATKVSNSPSVSFKFTLKYGDTTSACDMVVAKEKYHLSSPQMKVWYDGNTQWTYAVDNHELSITEPTVDELLEANPFAILNHYDRIYNARRLKTNSPGDVVELTAKAKTENIRKAIVTIDPSTHLPLKMVVTMSNGRTFTVNVVSSAVGKVPAASTFVYDKKKFPASEIIDLR